MLAHLKLTTKGIREIFFKIPVLLSDWVLKMWLRVSAPAWLTWSMLKAEGIEERG